jgi:hypothetical protein
VPDADNENAAPTFCYFCSRRAVLVEGGGPNAFCIKCMDAGNKRHANDILALPTDLAMRTGIDQALGISSGFFSITRRG